MAHILVVDDEEYMRDLLSDILEEAGHRVETAVDGAAADAVIVHEEPDLIITDILMPNKGGLKLIGELRARGSTVPVIAISGGGKDGKLRFLSTAATFPNVKGLDKPFGHQELIDAVERSLG
jgi:DNA-binding NtrC family response regulator